MNKAGSNAKFIKPNGMFAAIVTPFSEDGSVNKQELKKLISWLIDKGVHGIAPLGSIGEFIHLKDEQKKQVVKTVLEESGEKVPVFTGATESCSSRSIDFAGWAHEEGCAGAFISPPYYLKVSQELIEAHYEEISKAVPDFALLLYNIPLFSEAISYDVVKRLSRIENIVGLKDSSGSMVDQMHFMDKIKIAGEDVNYMVGREDIVFPSLMVGASGAITGSCGIIPEALLGIYDAFINNQYEKAFHIQNSILSLIRAMFAAPFPLGFKAALECRGFKMGPSKLKLSSAEEYNYFMVRSRIYKILNKLDADKIIQES